MDFPALFDEKQTTKKRGKFKLSKFQYRHCFNKLCFNLGAKIIGTSKDATFSLIFKRCAFIHACKQPDLMNEILDDPFLRDLKQN